MLISPIKLYPSLWKIFNKSHTLYHLFLSIDKGGRLQEVAELQSTSLELARMLEQVDATRKNIKLAINLFGAVLNAPVVLPLLKKLIKASHVDPSGFIFEVTETTAAVSNFLQAKPKMTAVKALGCQFSLDDFGVGFASLNYMR